MSTNDQGRASVTTRGESAPARSEVDAFLTELKEVGRATAEAWITDHFEALGRRSTIDIEVTYL